MNEKKIFTRQEKLVYYARKVLELEIALDKARARLAFISSDKYQDWNSSLSKELDRKKGA